MKKYQKNHTNFPIVAIIGRPNVGKSTIVNRILNRREAIVEDIPGVTRDHVAYNAEWNDNFFTLIDTGGLNFSTKDNLDNAISMQAEIAIDKADVVIFVVDGIIGPTSLDEEIVKILHTKKKPVILVANKLDNTNQDIEASYFWSLGIGEPYPVSGIHGRGIADLLDAISKILPKKSLINKKSEQNIRSVAIIGRPNVGKSSLLNNLFGENRVIVSKEIGTTRDCIDENVLLDGEEWQFIDTAGLYKSIKTKKGADFYASIRTQNAIERSELVLVLFDAYEGLHDQDIRIVQQVIDAGKSLVFILNKWDILNYEKKHDLEISIKEKLSHMSWVPRINISAKTGWHTNRLTKVMKISLNSWDTRISTGKLNVFINKLTSENPHPVRKGVQPRILFSTQVSIQPPKFVFFTTGFLEENYRRFIIKHLRENFSFQGTPIEINLRIREKRSFK